MPSGGGGGGDDELLEWPAGSGFRWVRRDSAGRREGPGGNVFDARNAFVDAETGHLVLRVRRASASAAAPAPGDGLPPQHSPPRWSCGEVFLERSLGLGQYRFEVETDARDVPPRCVAAAFLFARDGHEFDVELTRWGQQSDLTAQFAVQPVRPDDPGTCRRFALRGRGRVFVVRWLGAASPGDVQFEARSGGSGRTLFSWAGEGGNNFAPGDERVHLNAWALHAPAVAAAASATAAAAAATDGGDDAGGAAAAAAAAVAAEATCTAATEVPAAPRSASGAASAVADAATADDDGDDDDPLAGSDEFRFVLTGFEFTPLAELLLEDEHEAAVVGGGGNEDQQQQHAAEPGSGGGGGDGAAAV